MLLNHEIRIEMLGSSGSYSIRDLTSLVKDYQSTLLPIGSASVHNVLVDQLQPQSNKLGVLTFLVIRLVRVAEPLFKTCRSLLMIQS